MHWRICGPVSQSYSWLVKNNDSYNPHQWNVWNLYLSSFRKSGFSSFESKYKLLVEYQKSFNRSLPYQVFFILVARSNSEFWTITISLWTTLFMLCQIVQYYYHCLHTLVVHLKLTKLHGLCTLFALLSSFCLLVVLPFIRIKMLLTIRKLGIIFITNIRITLALHQNY